MEMTYYTGIDVSLRSVSICGVDDRGEVCLETKVEAEIDAIVEHLRRFSSEVKSVGVEAGALTQHLIRGQQRGLRLRYDGPSLARWHSLRAQCGGLGVQSQGVVTLFCPDRTRTCYGKRSSRLRPYYAASSSRAPSVARQDQRLSPALRAETHDGGQVARSYERRFDRHRVHIPLTMSIALKDLSDELSCREADAAKDHREPGRSGRRCEIKPEFVNAASECSLY
jgi:hypothetical protein